MQYGFFIHACSSGLAKKEPSQSNKAIQVCHPYKVIYHYTFINSRPRYWLFLLVTFLLNIIFIVYFQPIDPIAEEFCPTISSLSNITENSEEFITATFITGSIYAVLVIWMVLEFLIVSWPHFVLPPILYLVKEKLDGNRMTKLLAKYVCTHVM